MDDNLSTTVERADNETTLVCNRFGECFESDHVPFWLTKTGQIIRWSVFWGLFLIFMLWIVIGYWHAKRRLSKGLKPLAYHRWMLNRRQRAQFEPAYQQPNVYYNQFPAEGQYGMHPMPPPMYNPNAPMLPTYQPPAGATKVDPSQWRSQPTRRPADDGEDPAPDYEAPPGPPPNLPTNNTGAGSHPFRG